jgi:hypothetical protein
MCPGVVRSCEYAHHIEWVSDIDEADVAKDVWVCAWILYWSLVAEGCLTHIDAHIYDNTSQGIYCILGCFACHKLRRTRREARSQV